MAMSKAFTTTELEAKSSWVRREILRLHGLSPETRIASSLSAVEILTVLFYSGNLSYNPQQPLWDGRDRFIASKGHGSIALYPILSDLGYFPTEDLKSIGKSGSYLGSIPDPVIPGYETVNGSLGHGPGVGAGMALGLRTKGNSANVVILVGDGELYEGSVWEAIMFAGHHRLDNMTIIVDNNKIAMLDYCEKIISHGDIGERFSAFGWECRRIDGHDEKMLSACLEEILRLRGGKPKLIIADTIKGKGVAELEGDKLSHIKSLKAERIAELLGKV